MPKQESTQRDVLSPSSLHILADSENERKVIPAAERQTEIAKIGDLAASAAEYPNPGEQAELKFSDGTAQTVRVDGYDRNKGNPQVQIGVGRDQEHSSNIDMAAFQNLTREK